MAVTCVVVNIKDPNHFLWKSMPTNYDLTVDICTKKNSEDQLKSTYEITRAKMKIS